eukprot:7376049-Prymnesium_polylepis.3
MSHGPHIWSRSARERPISLRRRSSLILVILSGHCKGASPKKNLTWMVRRPRQLMYRSSAPRLADESDEYLLARLCWASSCARGRLRP